MKPCQMAGGQCPREAVTTVRVDGRGGQAQGDRPMCREDADFVVRMGFGREIDPNAFVPEWRKNLTGGDQTGLVLAR